MQIQITAAELKVTVVDSNGQPVYDFKSDDYEVKLNLKNLLQEIPKLAALAMSMDRTNDEPT